MRPGYLCNAVTSSKRCRPAHGLSPTAIPHLQEHSAIVVLDAPNALPGATRLTRFHRWYGEVVVMVLWGTGLCRSRHGTSFSIFSHKICAQKA